ncbi:hypothetical protein BAUCODRAFT_150628 [Baudoinia panamericana UAMH 10762]|uniref:F-box domain-containing protein n=1 Tax=Baudoinia panamericana (strain UAMH 10762) TaxID=717646 RepID=M2MP81_BAUPA|nr:uncharacterized protein BAUCODRAFT_150628 [Baudoinia panamericana UAMH 10762]EMC93278.1 hypothetical protein BAUCODRAFT_150628 [Baudoinia panamericana UAMH 10762]
MADSSADAATANTGLVRVATSKLEMISNAATRLARTGAGLERLICSKAAYAADRELSMASAAIRIEASFLDYCLHPLRRPRALGKRQRGNIDDGPLQKVFAVPEMLENILCLLSSKELLNVQLINKAFKALVKTSPKLQTRIGLRSSDDGDFYIPLKESGVGEVSRFCSSDTYLPGLVCNFNNWSTAYTLEPRQSVHYYLFPTYFASMDSLCPPPMDSARVIITLLTGPNGRLPAVGHSWQEMFVSQPPLKEVRVETHRFAEGDRPSALDLNLRSAAGTLSVVEGIRLRDILQFAVQIVEPERLHPDVPAWSLNNNGFANQAISFEGRIKLRDSDPWLRGVHAWQERSRKQQDNRNTHEARIAAYSRAKQADKSSNPPVHTVQLTVVYLARAMGERIPTLAEWNAMQDHDNVAESA